jgi:hypothetical protein
VAIPAGRRSQKRQRRMEPLWSPVVATGGNRRQIGSAQTRPKQAKTFVVGCDRLPETFMVRGGGSTVRVRQRALQKPRLTALFVSDRLAGSRTWGRYGALFGAFRSKTRSWRAAQRQPGHRPVEANARAPIAGGAKLRRHADELLHETSRLRRSLCRSSPKAPDTRHVMQTIEPAAL